MVVVSGREGWPCPPSDALDIGSESAEARYGHRRGILSAGIPDLIVSEERGLDAS